MKLLSKADMVSAKTESTPNDEFTTYGVNKTCLPESVHLEENSAWQTT